MAVALPQAMPAIHMGDQYDLTRLQDNTKSTVDLLLQAVAALQTASSTTAVASRASLGVLSADTLFGTNTLAPAASGELISMPQAGSVIAVSITSKNAAGTGISAPSAGSLVGQVFKNGTLVAGAATTMTSASGVSSTVFTPGVYTFGVGDYFQLWRSSTSLANAGSNRYIFEIWVAFN